MAQLAAPIYFDRNTPPHVTTLVLMAGTATIPINLFLASLPAMAEYFDTPYSIMQFTVTGYLAMSALMQLIVGPLSDLIGRRPVVLVSIVIFIFASIGSALATTFEVFIIFRLIQTTMVAGFVISRACVRDMVSREKAASMIGYVTMGMSLAPMLGPPIGGLLGDLFGWQSNFYAFSVMGLIALFVLYFDQGETNLNKSSSFMAQVRTYPELFSSRRFWGYTFTLVFASGTFFAYLGGAPFVGDKVYGLSASEVGLYLAITPMGYMFGNGISGRFSAAMGIYRMLIIGSVVTLVMMSMPLVALAFGITHPLGFFAFTFFIGFGNGMVIPSANAGMLDIKPELAGSATGLSGAMMTLGGAGLSVMAAFFLTETSGAYPLIYCILGTALLCVLAALLTISIEKKVRGDEQETSHTV